MRRNRPLVHCTWVVLLGLLAFPGRAAGQPQSRAVQAIGYTVFVRGTPLGREAVTITRDPSGTTIASQGRLAAPINLTLRSAEFKYRPDWTPVSFMVDAAVTAGNLLLRTSITDTTAATEGTQGSQPVAVSHTVARRTLLHANGVFASYVALAHRLSEDSEEGAEFRLYVVPQAEITIGVRTIRRERMQIGTSFLDVRRFELVYGNPGGDLITNLTIGSDGNLISVNIPAQSLDVVREDVASSTSRTQIYSNPGDEAVIIPAVGFNLGATITRPAGGAAASSGQGRASAAQRPAVILLSGSGVGDRDGTAAGVPTLAQLAGVFAEAGIVAVRYDKRGNGQSGGRSESATLTDFAEDVRAVFRWLERQPDVDRKRIAVVGHSEGAWVAMLAASRERRIAAVVSIAGPSSTGSELILEQQRAALDRMDLTPDDRAKRIELQKQIQSAVLTGKGWDEVPADLRREADTPWFQSLLAFDPGRVVRDVRQPMLFLHGALDRQVPVEHAERLAGLAQKTSRSKSVELVVVRGVNHLLVPAVTGEVSEYGTLPDRNVSRDVTMTIANWLAKTFAAIR